MDVKATHHIDASDPGTPAAYSYRYEYDIYRFTDDGEIVLVARSYKHAPHEAHFLRIERNGKYEPLKSEDLKRPLFLEAVSYLWGIGKRKVTSLTEQAADGYEPI